MKKSFTIVLFLVFSFFFLTNIFPQDDVWNRIQPTPQEHSLFCVRQIPGTEKMVAVGSGSTIMYSDDEGESWDITLNPAGLPNNTWFMSVSFFDEMNGWAAANYGRVIRTTDGGESWELIYDNLNDTLKADRLDIYLSDAETAIIVGYNRLILKTEDGGESWATSISPPGFFPNSIDFASSDTGYIVGKTDTAIILKTIDKGESWLMHPFNKMSGSMLFDICFISDVNGIISAYKYGGDQGDTTFVYKTNDGGKSWDIVCKKTGTRKVGEISFKDEMHGAIRITSWVHSFLYTNDGGESWEPDNDDFFYNYTPCYSFFYGQQFMIGVGSHGLIGRLYTDAEEWERLSEHTYFGICRNALFTSEQIAYTLFTSSGGGGVNNGNLLKSTDVGHSWNSVLNTYMGNFDFINDNEGFALKNEWEGLQLYKTVNGGTYWSFLTNFGEVDLWDDQPIIITFLDSLNGIVAFLENSFITNDGGNSWQTLFILQAGWDDAYHSVDYLSEDTIFLSGFGDAHPIFIKSFDGGQTFDVDTLDLYGHIAEKVYFVDHSTGFLLVNKYETNLGFIYKTSDAGASWYPALINDTNYSSYKNIFFATKDIGYVVGSGNNTTMLKTLDGGESWNPIDIPCSSGLSQVYFHDEWHGFVFGSGGIIMETFTGGVVSMEENPFVVNSHFFDVSPNPSKDIIKIELYETPDNKLIIEVYNLNSDCIYKGTEANFSARNSLSINLTGYATGLYFCRITNGNKVCTKKIIKL